MANSFDEIKQMYNDALDEKLLLELKLTEINTSIQFILARMDYYLINETHNVKGDFPANIEKINISRTAFLDLKKSIEKLNNDK